MCKRFLFSFSPKPISLCLENGKKNENYIFDLPINRSGTIESRIYQHISDLNYVVRLRVWLIWRQTRTNQSTKIIETDCIIILEFIKTNYNLNVTSLIHSENMFLVAFVQFWIPKSSSFPLRFQKLLIISRSLPISVIANAHRSVAR